MAEVPEETNLDSETEIIDAIKFSNDTDADSGLNDSSEEEPIKVNQVLVDRMINSIDAASVLENNELSENIIKSSICGLGQSAPNPVTSALKYFREEFEEHAVDKKCRTQECKALAKITIDPEKCKACGLCQKSCPVNAIKGEAREIREIDQDICIKCGTCIKTCPFKAIS